MATPLAHRNNGSLTEDNIARATSTVSIKECDGHFMIEPCNVVIVYVIVSYRARGLVKLIENVLS